MFITFQEQHSDSTIIIMRILASRALALVLYLCGSSPLTGFVSLHRAARHKSPQMSTQANQITTSSSWSDLQDRIASTPVGKALNEQVELRKQGHGSPHVQNTLRQFDSSDEPQITLYRDHAGW